MARAAFFVNQLKIIDQGDHVVLEGTHTCKGGHVIDRVFVKVPGALRHLFRETDSRNAEQASPDQGPHTAGGRNRLDRYFGSN